MGSSLHAILSHYTVISFSVNIKNIDSCRFHLICLVFPKPQSLRVNKWINWTWSVWHDCFYTAASLSVVCGLTFHVIMQRKAVTSSLLSEKYCTFSPCYKRKYLQNTISEVQILALGKDIIIILLGRCVPPTIAPRLYTETARQQLH